MNKLYSNKNLAAALLVLASIFLVIYFSARVPITEPKVSVEKEIVSTVPEVEVVKIKKETRPLIISSYGKVQPHRNLTIQSEVKGRIIEQSLNLDAGGILKEGEILLKLDPRDYVVDVEQNRAKVEKAEFELIQEKGKKVIAEREWDLLDSTLQQGGIGKDLALRIPHLREKESALHAAQSSLEKSLVDLKRTLIRAPFNSLVLEEFVEKGQLLAAQTKIANVVSTDEFRILVSVPFDQISRLEGLNLNSEEKLGVKVIQDIGKNRVIIREGEVLRYLGDLDPNGRMIQLLIVVKDPLNLDSDDSSIPPLLLGSNVKIEFPGPEIKDLVVLPKAAIHEENKVWVNENGKLKVKQVQILASDKEQAFVRGDGFEEGEQVIISPITIATPGMEIKVKE